MISISMLQHKFSNKFSNEIRSQVHYKLELFTNTTNKTNNGVSQRKQSFQVEDMEVERTT